MEVIEKSYLKYYYRNIVHQVYPREWLIRALLGPGLKDIIPSSLRKLDVLDIGFGDCRNFPILRDLEASIYGTEISPEIVKLGVKRSKNLKIESNLKVGWNDALPFDNDFFNIAIASSSLYFLRDNVEFHHYLTEVHRVIKSGSIFLCSLVKLGSQILENAVPQEKNVYIVNRGKTGLSNGSRIVVFDTVSEVEKAFMPYFKDIRIAVSENNYWGVTDYHYLVCAIRK